MKKHFLWKTYKIFYLKELFRGINWGQLLLGQLSWGNYPGDNYPGTNCPEEIFLGAIIWGVIIRGAIILGDNCLGGNCPGGNYPRAIVLELCEIYASGNLTEIIRKYLLQWIFSMDLIWVLQILSKLWLRKNVIRPDWFPHIKSFHCRSFKLIITFV